MCLILSLNEPDKSNSPLSIPFLKIPLDTIIIPIPRPSKCLLTQVTLTKKNICI